MSQENGLSTNLVEVDLRQCAVHKAVGFETVVVC